LASTIKIGGGSPGADKILTSDADGDATWEDAAGGGSNRVLITSTEASNDSLLTFTGLTSHDVYEIEIENLDPQTAAAILRMRVGASGGIVTAAQYNSHSQDLSSTSVDYAATVAANTGDGWDLSNTDGLHTLAQYGGFFRLYRGEESAGVDRPLLHGQFVMHSATTGELSGGAVVAYLDPDEVDMDRFDIQMSTGNIVSGRITVWGITYT